MRPSPLISLVTPSYNQGRFLRETIESVVKQGYSNWELWVMDAASTDETVDILKSYAAEPRIKWVSEKDEGQSDAICKGLARCTGDIFNWLNSDDYLEPGALQAVADAFTAEPDVEVICGVCRKFEDLTGETSGFMQTELKGNAEDTILIGRICQQGTFFRTDVFRALDGPRKELDCSMDWHLWVMYLVARGLAHVRKCNSLLAHFRQHPASKTGTSASVFKQEVNAIYLDLFTALGAPEYLREYLRSITAVQMTPTAWKPGPHFRARTLFSKYCEKIMRLYFYDQAYERASVWLGRAMDCEFRLSPRLLRFYWKIFYKKNILKQGFKF